MSSEFTENDMKELASQLRRPHGLRGIELGEYMSLNNALMINEALNTLSVQENEAVLEIGFGNGAHVSKILENGSQIRYTGIDISELMVDEAQTRNREWVRKERACFQCTDGRAIPFQDSDFDGIFSVNTLYFWEQPQEYLNEMFRVLKPGGRLILSFAAKSFLEKIGAQNFGFEIYETKEIEVMMNLSGFSKFAKQLKLERVDGKSGEKMERQFLVTKGIKPAVY